RSIDAGATWTTVVPQANPNYIRLDPLGRAVFYSIPEGRTVCKFASGLPRCSELSAEARSFYFLPANPDVIYASGGARIFRSTDNGESWSQLQATYRPTLAKTVDLVSTTLMPGTTTALPLEVKLMETTAQAVPFTAAPSGEPWWSVRPTSGTTPATLSLDFRATGLAEGAYTGTLRVESAATANGSVSIPLRLTVGVPPSSGAAYRIRHVAGRGTYGVSVDTGPAATSLLAGPEGLALDPSANLWIADSGSSLLRRISSDGMISIVAGQVLKPGFSGDGGPAAAAQLRRPLALAFDTAGGYYVADQGNNRLRYVSSTGAIRTVAGDDRIGAANPAWYVAGVAVDRRNGGAFFASELNNRVYRVDASGRVTTLAGGGTLAAGTALQIALNKPTALSTDSAGNLYVAETGAHRIRRIDPAGLVTTIAGTGQSGFSGDNGPASAAALSAPEGVAVDPAGNVVISDTGNHRIRLVAKDGTIRTIAGIGNAGWSGDDGPGWQAQLNRPTGLAIDAKGVIYFSDTGNNRIRKLEPQTGPQVTSLVNGAGYQPEIAPGSWFVLTGIALSSTTRTWRDSEIVNGVLPTELDGVKVRINGREAAIYFISPTQINGLAPANLPEGPADVQVVRGAETSASFTATVRALSPAFFVMLAPSYAAARHHPDYKLVALPEQFPGCTAGIDCPPRPAQPGEWLLFYGTGFGPVTSAVPPLMTLPVRVRFGSTWAEGLGALASPGLYQIAVQVPEATPEGDIPVIAEVGGRQTPTVTIPVRRR
nr:hypothetical protein [Akkermansiaceae bacterium]